MGVLMGFRWNMAVASCLLILFSNGYSMGSNINHGSITESQDAFEYNGLYWRVGPDRDMTWDEAKEWVDGLGGDWRMPTRTELQDLWDSGISYGNWGPFENSGWFVWSGEVHDSSSAWGFFFDDGIELLSSRGISYSGEQAFAVLSR